MPKRKQQSRSMSNGEEASSRTRSRFAFAAIKTKLRRHRSGSVEGDQDALPPLPMREKCSTLPARVSSMDIKSQSGSKPQTLFWMVGLVDELEGSLNNGATMVSREDSDESVDSGFHQTSKQPEEPEGLKESNYAKKCTPTRGSLYDIAAVEKAFGPMKDVGRWYSSYSSQQVQEGRYIPRPMAPIPLQSLQEDEEHRLTSRPLPPIPSQDAPPLPRKPSIHGDSVYEHIEHRLLGSNGLSLDLRSLAQYGWYWGPITRLEAEEKLAKAKDGTFLVRDSSDERYLLSLSFHSQGKTLHTRIEYCNGYFSFYSFPDSESEGYTSVVELIERSMQYSKDGVFCFSRARAIGSPAVPVRLLKPFSRFNHVRTLQHYCRFVVRQSIRFDKIRQLPLPRHVHGYLEQSQF